MSSRHEYSAWQWLLPFTRGNWKPAFSDLPANRRLNRENPVRAVVPADWDTDQHTALIADDLVAFPKQWKKGKNHLSRAAQRADLAKSRITFTIGTADYGYYEAEIPQAQGGYWIEGNPRPLWSMNGSHYDRHVILVAPKPDSDGVEVWEMIGVNNLFGKWTAAGLGRWNSLGKLVWPDKDRAVCWGKTQMSSEILNVNDVQPHALALTVRGDDNDEPHFPWQNEWLALPDTYKDLPVTTDIERLIVRCLVEYGAYVRDHGGRTKISAAEGIQWDLLPVNSPLRKIRLRDFYRVKDIFL